MKSVQIQSSFDMVQRLESRLLLSGGAGNVHNSIVVGDFNGDGVVDMIASNPGSRGKRVNNGVVIMLGNGDGTYHKAQLIGGQGFAHGAALDVGDFNKDGHLDLVIYGGSNPASSKKNGTAVNGLLVLFGHGDGTFSRAANIGGPLFAGSTDPNSESRLQGSIAVGDIDKDGNTDITISDPDLNGGTENGLSDIFIIHGHGDGTFSNGVQAGTA